jgi:hypothetical protein
MGFGSTCGRTSSELVLQLGAQAYPIGQVRQTVRTATLVALEDVFDDNEPEGSVRITFMVFLVNISRSNSGRPALQAWGH